MTIGGLTYSMLRVELPRDIRRDRAGEGGGVEVKKENDRWLVFTASDTYSEVVWRRSTLNTLLRISRSERFHCSPGHLYEKDERERERKGSSSGSGRVLPGYD